MSVKRPGSITRCPRHGGKEDECRLCNCNFEPGDIVVQKISIGEKFVGMVVGKHMAEKLSEAQRAEWEWLCLEGKEDDYRILLVFQSFIDPTQSAREPRSFPYYTIGRANAAREYDFAMQIEILEHYSFLRATNCEIILELFSPNFNQLKSIEMVAVAQALKKNQETPYWVSLSKDRIEALKNEICLAINPLPSAQEYEGDRI